MARYVISRRSYPPFVQIFGDGKEADWTFIDPA
jgi:hypothetical protein